MTRISIARITLGVVLGFTLTMALCIAASL